MFTISTVERLGNKVNLHSYNYFTLSNDKFKDALRLLREGRQEGNCRKIFENPAIAKIGKHFIKKHNIKKIFLNFYSYYDKQARARREGFTLAAGRKRKIVFEFTEFNA